jgi:hypothetical protein
MKVMNDLGGCVTEEVIKGCDEFKAEPMELDRIGIKAGKVGVGVG